MRYRKLTADGDYSFGASQLDFYRDVPEAVGQAAQTRMLLWLGEWFLDVDEGTPFMIGILGKHPNLKERSDVTIQDRISGTQGMVDIDQFESEINPETRTQQVNVSINTIYGPTLVQIENYKNY